MIILMVQDSFTASNYLYLWHNYAKLSYSCVNMKMSKSWFLPNFPTLTAINFEKLIEEYSDDLQMATSYSSCFNSINEEVDPKWPHDMESMMERDETTEKVVSDLVSAAITSYAHCTTCNHPISLKEDTLLEFIDCESCPKTNTMTRHIS